MLTGVTDSFGNLTFTHLHVADELNSHVAYFSGDEDDQGFPAPADGEEFLLASGFIPIETITAKLLGQYCESCGVGRVDLAGSAGLRNDASDDGVFRVGITVRVRGIASCGLAPEDHMIWVAACGVSVQSTISQEVMDIPESFDVLA